jgi:type IV pilus assembly protein PilX
VLIVGLIILVIITMIGLTSMQTTTQQERMAGNLGDRNAALQFAEGALRQGEDELTTGLANYTANASIGRFDVVTGAYAPDPLTDDWGGDFTSAAAVSVSYSSVQVTPRYRIDRQPSISFSASIEAGAKKDLEVFEVTSYSSTVRNDTIVVLQTTFTR